MCVGLRNLPTKKRLSGSMGELVKIHFSPEQQDLVGTIDTLSESAENDLIVAIGYVVQTEDGTYEMSWAGDVSHYSMIEALKVLIRALRKEAHQLAKE